MELIIGSLSRPSLSLEPKNPLPTLFGKKGVCVPEAGRAEGGWRASREAWRRRLVVPSAFVCDDLAEQTSATRDSGMYDLDMSESLGM